MGGPVEPTRDLGELLDILDPEPESLSLDNSPSRERSRGRSNTRLQTPGPPKGLGNRQSSVQDLDSDEDQIEEEISTKPHRSENSTYVHRPSTTGAKRGPPIFATPERQALPKAKLLRVDTSVSTSQANTQPSIIPTN